jgi:hypothetical protein
MQPGRFVLLLLPVIAVFVLADEDEATGPIVKARVESCGG